MECEGTDVESRPSITSCKTLNKNDETEENNAESVADETNPAQSNVFVMTEDSCNLLNKETCLESNKMPNETDFLTSSQSHVSLRQIQTSILYLQINKVSLFM